MMTDRTQNGTKFKALKAAFPFTLPVLIGYIVLGIAFGVILSGRGFEWWIAPLMALFIYAGSLQFVVIDLLAAAFNPLNAFVMALTVNVRHLFYGISMLGKFRDMGKEKPYMVLTLTDETYSLLCSVIPPEGVDRNWFYLSISALNQCYWVLGCTLGAIGGSFLNYDTSGFDFVMTALFIVILVEQWEQTRFHLPVLLGISVSLLSLLLFGSQNFILPAMAGIPAAMALFRGRIESGFQS